MRKMSLLAIITACLALTAGCGSSTHKLGGDAAPAGGPSASASPSWTPSQPATTTPTTGGTVNAPPAPTVLGPTGFGALKLGMTEQQAEATGTIKPFKTVQLSDVCTKSSNLDGAPSGQGTVLLNKNLGVAIIAAYPGVRTHEGLKIGDSLATAQRIYPNADVPWSALGQPNRAINHALVQVPGNSKAYYRIGISDAGKVDGIALQLMDQGCHE
jgi:hypothetical protein